MPLNRPHFDIYVNGTDDTPTEHLNITITHQDQLQAESAMLAANVDTDRALALTTAWCWAALRRLGLHRGPLQRFLDTECAGVENAAQGVTGETVDPTQLAAEPDSASDSPVSGPGSTG